MDCRTAESMISRYITRNLKEKELEEFLKHIEACASCYEELETYFIVNEAAKQLSSETEESKFNIKGMLESDIQKTKKVIHRRKTIHRMENAVSFAAVLVFLSYFVRVVIGLF